MVNNNISKLGHLFDRRKKLITQNIIFKKKKKSIGIAFRDPKTFVGIG